MPDDLTPDAPPLPRVVVTDIRIPFEAVIALVFKFAVAAMIVGGAIALLWWIVWLSIFGPSTPPRP